jgi:hypothetical protein
MKELIASLKVLSELYDKYLKHSKPVISYRLPCINLYIPTVLMGNCTELNLRLYNVISLISVLNCHRQKRLNKLSKSEVFGVELLKR